ncbi:MAG: glucose 1-dehydrogenase [Spirochaetales bacterium]|nr:glucose 1-dehydrogenase [Spirochaetales bacterium]
MKLEGKVAIVTGAGAGIGEATAILLAREGAKVCCNSLSDSARRLAEAIKDSGGQALFVQGDVSLEKDAHRIVDQTIDAYQTLHVLVNNAGVVLPGTLESTSMEDWERTLAVNLRGVFLMSRFAISHLKATRGTIVNTSSVVALKGVKDRLAYSASKGAINALTRALAVEYVDQGIRVNAVCPGIIDTPSLAQRLSKFEDPDKAREQFVARQPLKRMGSPEEIAEAILFLIRDEFCTGACLSVDGGMTM